MNTSPFVSFSHFFSHAFVPSALHTVAYCKLVFAFGITCASLLLVTGCASGNASSEGEIVTQPVTQEEVIAPSASDALDFADENTDYPYTDITGDILFFIDEGNKMLYGTTPSEHDTETLAALAQSFYNKMPDINMEKTEFACFEDARLDPKYSVSLNLPAREYYELPQGITIPAQDAVNQAAAVIKAAFAPDCTIENAYIYYSNSLVVLDTLTDTCSWVVLLTTTLSDGTASEFTVKIDAVTGALQRANYMGAYHYSGSVSEKTNDPITKDNYETYATKTLAYLRAAGVSVDESIAPIVTRYMSNSKYAIVYTTTTGDHYQAFLYTDGTCASIKQCDTWASQSQRIVPIEEMQNYTMD